MRKIVQICFLYNMFLLLLLFLAASESSNINGSEHCALEEIKVCDEEAGTHNPYCGQNMSRYCNPSHGINKYTIPKTCFDTLQQKEDSSVCELELVRDTDPRCGDIKPQHITPTDESVVQLRLYYYHSDVWGDEALVNLTFPNATWRELEFQSSVLSSNVRDICINFTLHQNISSTLMYDCRFRTKMTSSQPLKLTVQTESGYGASYIYQIPPGFRVNPRKTCPSEWHTFFYIQEDAIERLQPLPVTVQSAPFGVVDYKVSLGMCPEAEDEDCTTFREVDHVTVTKNTSDDLWTVELSPVNQAGNYAVSVQIVSDWCTTANGTNGCHIAVSPKFYIDEDLTWLIQLLVILSIILFLLCVIGMIWNRGRVNRAFFKRLATKKTTVLMVYHPESPAARKFVQKLAEFLRNSCGITPLLMDDVVGLAHPTLWIKNSMNTADRVLFVVPRDAEAPSCTPFTSQWKTAMGECSGSDFIANPECVRRLAKLVHARSGDVPCEIGNIRRFDLSHSPAALANWLHGGSYLDKFFMWLPHFRSAVYRNAIPSWAHVRLAAQQIGLPPTEAEKGEESFTSPLVSVSMNMLQGTIDDDEGGGEDGSNDNSNNNDEADNIIVDDNDVDQVFDPEIPNVDKLCDQDSVSEPSPVNSDEEDLELFESGDVR